MVDFYDPYAARDSVTLQEMGTDVIPSTAGDVLGAEIGSAAAHGFGIRGMRATDRGAREQIARDAAAGLTTRMRAQPLLDTEMLKEKYAIPGHLSFDQPMTEESARDLFEHKHADLVRQDIIARRNGGVATGAVARFGAGLIGGLTDPVNLAVGVIPILGEARAASLLGRGAIEAMGAVERAGVRAVAGGVSGGVGMAALQPLEYALTRSEREDLTMAQVLHNIAFGAALGGGLHVAGGAVVDRVSRRYASPITQRIDDLGYENRREVLQGAVAQHLNDEPVNVAPALDLADAVRAERDAQPARGMMGLQMTEEEWARQLEGHRQRQAQAISEMAPRPEPVSEATRAANDAAKVSRETLPDVEREIADMETALGLVPPPRPVAGGERAAAEPAAAGRGRVAAQSAKLTARDLRVAARDKQGNVYVGEPGQIHADLLEKYDDVIFKTTDAAKFSEPGMGFVGPDGDFLTRGEALARLSDQSIAENIGNRGPYLEGIRLREAQAKDAAAPTEPRAPAAQANEVQSFRPGDLAVDAVAPGSLHPELFALRAADDEIEAAGGRAAASERAAKCIIDGII